MSISKPEAIARLVDAVRAAPTISQNGRDQANSLIDALRCGEECLVPSSIAERATTRDAIVETLRELSHRCIAPAFLVLMAYRLAAGEDVQLPGWIALAAVEREPVASSWPLPNAA